MLIYYFRQKNRTVGRKGKQLQIFLNNYIKINKLSFALKSIHLFFIKAMKFLTGITFLCIVFRSNSKP